MYSFSFMVLLYFLWRYEVLLPAIHQPFPNSIVRASCFKDQGNADRAVSFAFPNSTVLLFLSPPSTLFLPVYFSLSKCVSPSLKPFLSFSLLSPSSFPKGLRKHDVCFLITVRPNLPYGTRFDRRQPFVEQTGLVYVRGCEVQGMLDDKGRVIEEGMLICTHACPHRHTTSDT